MKKINLILCAIICVFSFSAFAASVCHDKFGTLHCGVGEIDDINYSGYVEVNGTTVTDLFSVLGNSDIQNAQINRIYSRGDVALSNSNFKGSVHIMGNVHASNVVMHSPANLDGNFLGSHITFLSPASIVGSSDCRACVFKYFVRLSGEVSISNSEFSSPILLNAKLSSFAHSKINDITVKKPRDDEEQTIQLTDGSVAHNITFESRKGIVVLSGNSSITGALQGGKVVIK